MHLGVYGVKMMLPQSFLRVYPITSLVKSGAPCLPRSRRASTAIRCMIVGIDLGTTNSAVSWVGPSGPEVLRQPDGTANVPSIVAFTEVAPAQSCVY